MRCTVTRERGELVPWSVVFRSGGVWFGIVAAIGMGVVAGLMIATGR